MSKPPTLSQPETLYLAYHELQYVLYKLDLADEVVSRDIGTFYTPMHIAAAMGLFK